MVFIMSHALVLAALADLSGRPQKQITLDMLLQGDLGLSDDYLRQLRDRLQPDASLATRLLIGALRRMTVGELIRALDRSDA